MQRRKKKEHVDVNNSVVMGGGMQVEEGMEW